MSFDIPLFELNFGEAEERVVGDVVRSRWISMGERTAEFEMRFAARLGVAGSVAVNSCTAALHLACVMSLEPGDEVVLPSLTFVATANAVRYCGATPVFADVVGPHDLTIDPDDVRRKITPRTKALIPMHYAGFSCAMGPLLAIAKERGLKVIEDAAHAPCSTYDGVALGTLGDFGCFSFYSNKNMTCAEGGLLVARSDDHTRRARLLRSHGMTTVSYDRARGHATRYDVVELGYNYRLDDIRAGLALAQLDRLDQDAARRSALRNLYSAKLRSVAGITVPFVEHGHSSSNYIFVVVLQEGGAQRRDIVRDRLAKAGIQTSVHYPPVHRFAIYASDTGSLPQTEFVADHAITLPLFNGMTDAQVDRVCASLQEALCT